MATDKPQNLPKFYIRIYFSSPSLQTSEEQKYFTILGVYLKKGEFFKSNSLYLMEKPFYAGNMDIALEFNEAAFRHGVSKENIRHAIKTKVYDAPLVDFSDKYAVIGFDMQGNPLEILYNFIDNDTISVFHAMKARKTFLARLGL